MGTQTEDWSGKFPFLFGESKGNKSHGSYPEIHVFLKCTSTWDSTKYIKGQMIIWLQRRGDSLKKGIWDKSEY